MTFIYFLISVVLFYYLFKFGMRLLMPFFMRKVAEKIVNGQQGQYANGGPSQQGYGDPFGQFRQTNSTRADGKVRVDYMPPKESKDRKGTETAGEFIDFEEVK
ncbi:DUF4834 family protein [Sphingobacterium lactis]|uniref:DUF4834 domain-containing protein n=1 Tax=Sphingobacterium lactis TaxID=797291 RepID=A0A1H5S0D1_9SPHI|nr:DUF4834 family protein [Sphingobacterium lactis]SEF44049.1 protein of unknown function [Sphingobacterium lactis]